MQNFKEAQENFLKEALNSRAANAVVNCLNSENAVAKYGVYNRNEAVKALAEDVEAEIQCHAALLFRTPGPLHNALQELMDTFMDSIDECMPAGDKIVEGGPGTYPSD
jgi:hypothetical protein